MLLHLLLLWLLGQSCSVLRAVLGRLLAVHEGWCCCCGRALGREAGVLHGITCRPYDTPWSLGMQLCATNCTLECLILFS